MASGHVNRTNRPNTWLHRPATPDVKISLANSEPSTHVQVFGRCARKSPGKGDENVI